MQRLQYPVERWSILVPRDINERIIYAGIKQTKAVRVGLEVLVKMDPALLDIEVSE